MVLTLNLDSETAAIIGEMKRLQSLVNEIEYESNRDGVKIDYSTFQEYTDLHNFNGKLGENLANAGRLELGLTLC